MSSKNAPWPCPACAGLLPSTLEACPHCQLPADWVDLLLALGYTLRQFHFWSVVGSLDKAEYRSILDSVRARQEDMLRAGQADQPVWTDTGLPERSVCWRCGHACGHAAKFCAQCAAPLVTPEVRLIRYQAFLGQEIRQHAAGGRLSPARASEFLAETTRSIDEVKRRLSQ